MIWCINMYKYDRRIVICACFKVCHIQKHDYSVENCGYWLTIDGSEKVFLLKHASILSEWKVSSKRPWRSAADQLIWSPLIHSLQNSKPVREGTSKESVSGSKERIPSPAIPIHSHNLDSAGKLQMWLLKTKSNETRTLFSFQQGDQTTLIQLSHEKQPLLLSSIVVVLNLIPIFGQYSSL